MAPAVWQVPQLYSPAVTDITSAAALSARAFEVTLKDREIRNFLSFSCYFVCVYIEESVYAAIFQIMNELITFCLLFANY